MTMHVVKLSLGELYALPEFEDINRQYAQASGHEELGEHHFSPAWYDSLEQKGALSIFAVVDDESRLHGYLAGFVSLLPHFAHVNVFNVDAIFCDEAARKCGMGLKLLRTAKQHARARGCKGVIVGAKVGTRAHRLYERIAKPMNTLFWVEP